jgi:hypothetical protein
LIWYWAMNSTFVKMYIHMATILKRLTSSIIITFARNSFHHTYHKITADKERSITETGSFTSQLNPMFIHEGKLLHQKAKLNAWSHLFQCSQKGPFKWVKKHAYMSVLWAAYEFTLIHCLKRNCNDVLQKFIDSYMKSFSVELRAMQQLCCVLCGKQFHDRRPV